jgi:hypothetical protein
MGYSGAGGKLILEKTTSKKSRDTVPLNASACQILPVDEVFLFSEEKF